MADGNGNLSYRDVYQLVDARLLDIKNGMETRLGSIENGMQRLETKFDTLEAGRLSRLEKDFADFRGEYKGRVNTNAFIIPLIISGVGIVISLLLRR